jgi:hypothetical protein
MPASTEQGSIGEPASDEGRRWLGRSVWQVPDFEVAKIRSWPSITAVSYHRDDGKARGEAIATESFSHRTSSLQGSCRSNKEPLSKCRLPGLAP